MGLGLGAGLGVGLERRGPDHSRASAALRLAGPPPGLTPLRLGEVRVRVRVRVSVESGLR